MEQLYRDDGPEGLSSNGLEVGEVNPILVGDGSGILPFQQWR